MSEPLYKKNIKQLIEKIDREYPDNSQFKQATHELINDIAAYIEQQEFNESEQRYYLEVLRILIEPDRVIQFRVDWEDDAGKFHSNRGFRVQFNNTLGPYKGGLRFTRNTNLDELMFLGFEQVFKNSLTGLPMGGAKGGSDFEPHGRSESEIRRFCQAFMTQLSHHIGPDRDIPAGDIGVGTREIGYMFHQYKTIKNQFRGVLTGKHPVFGGSCIREEATGYGCVYFAEHMMEALDNTLEGKKCGVSGAGNVAIYTAKKLIEKNSKVITLSDSKGVYVNEDGISNEELDAIIQARAKRIRLKDMKQLSGEYHKDKKPWHLKLDLAFPCATQNELDEEDAKSLVDNKAIAVIEGANMPCTDGAIQLLEKKGVVMGPSKAVNAGGVAVSGLEISQNRSRLSWEADQVDEKLKAIMKNIHTTCIDYGEKIGDKTNYRKAANIASFIKVAKAIEFSGLVPLPESH
ncbi:MAG: NADP-specific glutamate dehydrogenase [Gammaproteobacteria bacterium]|nr:NADP-specific glutamate dehydrogenase [Gammaproteobacteria bacterium]